MVSGIGVGRRRPEDLVTANKERGDGEGTHLAAWKINASDLSPVMSHVGAVQRTARPQDKSSGHCLRVGAFALT